MLSWSCSCNGAEVVLFHSRFPHVLMIIHLVSSCRHLLPFVGIHISSHVKFPHSCRWLSSTPICPIFISCVSHHQVPRMAPRPFCTVITHLHRCTSALQHLRVECGWFVWFHCTVHSQQWLCRSMPYQLCLLACRGIAKKRLSCSLVCRYCTHHLQKAPA